MKKSNQRIDNSVNQNILNIITPSGLEFNRTNLIVGDNYAKCITITKYPSNPNYGWLSNITAIEGTTAKIEFEPCDSGALIARCNEQIRNLRADLTTVREESVRQMKEKAVQDISSMIKRISQYGEVVGYLNIILMVQAQTEEKLLERLKKVESIIAAFGGGVRTLVFKQKEAYRCVSPYGVPQQKVNEMGARNMPLSTFIGGFANASSGINDGVGYMIGKSEKGKPIIIDTWKRGADRTNSNWLITGVPGVGKSTAIKNLLLREYALGTKIIIIDPEREYVEMVRKLNGDIINCGGGSDGKINPLQVRMVPKIDSDDEVYHDEGKGINDLALHFQTLRTFFKLYYKKADDIMATLEELLEELYAMFHITWDTSIEELKNEDFPIMEDLYQLACKKLEEKQEDKELQAIVKMLRSIAIGSDSFIWNGHTQIEAKRDIIDLDISSLLEGDERIQKAQYYNILSWCWNQISKSRTEKIILVVDEAYLLIDSEVPQSLVFLKNTSKRIRKYEGGLIVITHSVADLLDPAIKRHGQAIIDNACFKFLMGCDGKNLEETKKLFNLTESEESLLLSKQRGRGLLYVGAARLSAKIEVPAKFLEIMGNAGGR